MFLALFSTQHNPSVIKKHYYRLARSVRVLQRLQPSFTTMRPTFSSPEHSKHLTPGHSRFLPPGINRFRKLLTETTSVNPAFTRTLLHLPQTKLFCNLFFILFLCVCVTYPPVCWFLGVPQNCKQVRRGAHTILDQQNIAQDKNPTTGEK